MDGEVPAETHASIVNEWRDTPSVNSLVDKISKKILLMDLQNKHNRI